MPTDRNDDTDAPETSRAHGKRDGRESADPREQPGEFVDDMATNRFTPPPPPAPKRDE